MEFNEAKQVIRAALASASDEKLVEVLDAARAGEMPWEECPKCLAGRLVGGVKNGHAFSWVRARLACEDYGQYRPYVRLSDAYEALEPGSPLSARRQRVLVPMVLAEIRRRERERDVVATTASKIVEEAVEAALTE